MDISLQAGRTPGTEWKKKKLKKSEDASKLIMLPFQLIGK